MERLTIDEIIEYCECQVTIYENISKEYLSTRDISEQILHKYWKYKQIAEYLKELKAYRDAEEQGLLLRLDSKDKLIEVLATKLLHSEFGNCYMCTNPMKNITLDGVNNGCDGGCNTSEEFTVDDFLKKIVEEMQRKEEAEQKLASMQKGE